MLKRTPFKRNNRTRIKKVSDLGKLKKVARKVLMERMIKMFDEVWGERKHYCESCEIWLGDEPKTFFFDHLIEKSTHSEFTLFKDNIFLCCFDCHNKKTNGFPTEKHLLAINEFKKKYEL